MNIRIIPADFDKSEYNTHVLHPLQTWEWGEARSQMGTGIVRIGLYDNDQLVSCLLMTLHPIPYTNKKVGYIPRSPLPTPEILPEIKKIAEEKNIIFIKWEPDEAASEENKRKVESIQKDFPFIVSPHPLFPKWTMKLDLTPTEEELLANLKQKTRYNVRLAAKKGVTVQTEDNDKGFETFAKLYFETCKRQHYYGHDHEYHRIVWNIMKENIAHILVARYENEPLGCYELFYFNNTLYYPYGGSSDLHRNVMAPNLLMWEAIRLGKQLGAISFDMWGSSSPDYNEKDPFHGFTKFKEGYNAQFVEMIGSFDLIINKHYYTLYSTIHSLRNLYLRIRA